jgi:hypothetical protein
MYFGPHPILLTMDLQFAKHLTAVDVKQTIKRSQRAIRERCPDIKHIFIDSDSLRSSHPHPETST